MRICKNIRGYGVSLLSCALLCFSLYGTAMSATDEREHEMTSLIPVSPVEAIISPNGGRLQIKQETVIKKVNDENVIMFALPPNASNLQLHIPGHTVVRWSSTPVIQNGRGERADKRAEIERKKNELAAMALTLKARIALWQMQTPSSNAEDILQREKMMQSGMPELIRQKEEMQKRLQLVEHELSMMPQADGIGEIITVTLGNSSRSGQHAQVEYSYDLAVCGWHAMYNFNALPDDKKGDRVDVRFLAQVWQYSGVDWKNTKIVLATRGIGPREPEPLRKWVVGEEQKPKPQPRGAVLSAKNRAAGASEEYKMMDLTAAAAPTPAVAGIEADTQAVYASWTLSERGLPDGKSQIQITSDAWAAPLQWLARPNTDDNRVWLLAKYTLPQDQAWPQGSALYSVDSQSVGEGYFIPKGGEATLYFGADPRVSVHTTVDTSKQGETGFINTSKTWTGAWTYTIANQHDKAIKVRVERPAPMVANDNITVSYRDKPDGKVDEKEHMILWEVDVPAHGKTAIEHSITISSPVKLPLLPDVP